jgi:hypothetical protein
MTVPERRYDDRDVARILRRAGEIGDRERAEVTARGLTLRELEDIAEEVGLDVGRIRRAALELEEGRRVRPGPSLGTSPSQSAVRAVDGLLPDTSIRELIRFVDEHVDTPGIVTEALGGVRWTARDRWLSTQVAVGPSTDGTMIKVHERIDSRVPVLLHFVPTGWGAILGVAVAASAGVAALPAAAIVAGCGLVGTAAGRGVWEILADRSRRRVDALVATLAEESGRLPRQHEAPADTAGGA